MNIDGVTLMKQVNTFYRRYGGVCGDAASKAGLDPFTLYAVGSRETNLTDVTGDHGHGRGIWQLDDRSYTIPKPFPVVLQASIAAKLLSGCLLHFTQLGWPVGSAMQLAFSAYNAGIRGAEVGLLNPAHDADLRTAGGDYGRDVMERLNYIRSHV